MRCWSKWSCC